MTTPRSELGAEAKEKLPWHLAAIINEAWDCDGDQDPAVVAGHRIAELMLSREATAHARGREEALEEAARLVEGSAEWDEHADVQVKIVTPMTKALAAAIRALRRPPSPREEALEEAPPQATLEKKPEEPLTRVTVTGKKVPAPSGPPPAQVNPAPGGLQGRI